MESETKTHEAQLYSDTETYPLAKEWVEVLDELSSTEEGLEIRRGDQALREYIWTTSDEMSVIRESIADGTFSRENVDGQLGRAIYYAHPSLVDMNDRLEALELAAFGMAKEIREIPADEMVTRNIRMRRLASVLEEISIVTAGDTTRSQVFEDQALLLNQQVWNSNLDLATSPRKMHAGFSAHDIRFRKLSRSVMNGDIPANPEPFRREQAESYRDAIYAISQLRNAEDLPVNGMAGNASGALGEILAELFLRDMKIASGEIFTTDVSQSYIRQDRAVNDKLRLPVDKRVAFDLRVTNLETRDVTRIEIKKRTRGNLPEEVQKKQIKQVESYLPIIKVVELKIGYSLQNYLKIAQDHCTNMYHLHVGSGLSTNAQRRATRIVDEQLAGPFSDM